MKKAGIGSHTLPNSGGSDSWITPRHIIDTFGPFDLDPCACIPQPWACAKRSYTIKDNGLTKTWQGRVWLNPPYSTVGLWLADMVAHNCGTALIFARTETKVFQQLVWAEASAVLFLADRLYFHLPSGERAKGNSGGPSVLVAYGKQDAERLAKCGLSGAFCRNWKNLSPRGKHGGGND